jgi:putative transposase
MPEYRRAILEGGTFFLTVVTDLRRPLLATDNARRLLRAALEATQRGRPFTIDAIVVLPDHFHCIWTLPPGDHDFSTRMRLVKGRFTHAFLAAGGRETLSSPSRPRREERSVWQRRFWEHTLRNDAEFQRLCNYIHYNPVKHGHASCPHAWPYSSFQRFVAEERYEASWQCICEGHRPRKLKLEGAERLAGE